MAMPQTSLLLLPLLLGMASCTGGSESGDDTSVARGGNDDYGVEIPVATSLTLADFGYDSSAGIISDIQDIGTQGASLLNSSSELAYMSSSQSASGDYVVAMIGPKNGESCAEFVAALKSEAKTEQWLCERRFYLPRSTFKAPQNGSLQMRVDATAESHSCTAVLAAEFLPQDACYQGHGGSIAFAYETEQPDEFGGDSYFLTKTWSDQGGLPSVKQVDTCGTSDPENNPTNEDCNAGAGSGSLSLSWLWDDANDTYRFIYGQGYYRTVLESRHKEWASNAPLAVSELGEVSSTNGHLVAGVAAKIAGTSIDRLAFISRFNQAPLLYNEVSETTWEQLTNIDFGQDSDAWAVGVLADGTTSYIDDLGSPAGQNRYRARVMNAFETRDNGNINGALSGTFACAANDGNMVSAPLTGSSSYFFNRCQGGANTMARLDATGFNTKDVNIGSIDQGRALKPAISVHPDRSADVFFGDAKEGEPGVNPEEFAFDLYVVQFDENLSIVTTGDVGDAKKLSLSYFQGDGDPAVNEVELKSLRAIKDRYGRSYVLIETSVYGSTSGSNVFLGTPFPNNELNIVFVDATQGDEEMSLGNMILYGRDL